MHSTTRTLACLLFTAFSVSATATGLDVWRRPAAAPVPENNALTPDRAELGRTLFFDTRLSAKGTMSCASCHNPSLGWTDGLATAVGHNMKILGRATPTIVNAAFNPLQMWDGRKNSLEDQALGPFESPDEQNLPIAELEAKVRSIPGYAPMFDQAYPGELITSATIAKAIASFERTVLSEDSAFDRWVAGNKKAMSPAAQRGFEVFQGKGNCALCHQGFNFTDNGFHNIGLAIVSNDDLGRFNHRKVAVLKGAFKTPTLRDVALTAPYMHNGAYATLEEVVEHYVRGGNTKENLDGNMRPLDLSPQDKADLVAFMRSLTSAPRVVAVPTLPR